MNRLTRSAAVLLLGLGCFAGTASAQLVQQTLKDAWVATNDDLLQVDYGESPTALVPKNPGDGARAFKAIAFELPDLGNGGARNLIAVDDTKLVRFADGTNATPPVVLFDASTAPSSLRYVSTIATTEAGTVLFSGYSRPKRVFELWELDPQLPAGDPSRVRLKVTGAPQLTDTAYVNAEDVPAGSLLSGGGLLGISGRDILFFPASGNHLTAVTLFDARQLPVKGNTKLLSVDLVRKTNVLMISTSERTLLTTSPSAGSVARFANVPDIAGRNCAKLGTQRLLVRNARGGTDTTTLVSDVCGQVLRYDTANPSSQLNSPVDTAIHAEGLVALAVGEGNEIVCLANEPCTLAPGFTTEIQSQSDTELLVLQFDDLCDRRVAGAACSVGTVLAGNVLDFNSLLPQSIRNALAEDGVTITIPPYMFGAGFDGRFGAILVATEGAGAAATAVLEIGELVGFELGVNQSFPRPTPVLSLLNQDVAAYAPDSSAFPTVGGFEATPVTTGQGSLKVSLRGFSAVLYGLQHDLNGAGSRTVSGGLPAGTVLNYGSPPVCDLVQGPVVFDAQDDPQQYFINLTACLFADEEELLRNVIPAAAFVVPSARAGLLANLENAKDKLIKALNAAGPNTGSENFQAVLTQVANYESAVLATAFQPQYLVYKNELLVRSEVFTFNLIYRAYPSLPAAGF